MAAQAPLPQPNYNLAECHALLKKAHEEKRLVFRTDFSHLNRPHMPSYSAWENLIPLLLLILLALFIMLVFKLMAGVMALLGAALLYLVAVRPWIAHRLHLRTVELMMDNYKFFHGIWERGGVTMIMVAPGNPPGCISPGGDWRAFAQRHFAEKKEVATTQAFLGGPSSADIMAPP